MSKTSAATSRIKDIGEQTYAGTVVWTGTTAPSGATAHNYHWSQFGKTVHLYIFLNYAVAGSSLTGLSLTLPADCPVPFKPAGLTADGSILCYANGKMLTSVTVTSNTAATNCILRVDAASATGYSFNILGGSSGWRYVELTAIYTTV